MKWRATDEFKLLRTPLIIASCLEVSSFFLTINLISTIQFQLRVVFPDKRVIIQNPHFGGSRNLYWFLYLFTVWGLRNLHPSSGFPWNLYTHILWGKTILKSNFLSKEQWTYGPTSGWQSFCPFPKMPLLILEGQSDLGHFAPPNRVSRNAPPVTLPLNWLSHFAPLSGGAKWLSWRGKMT